MTMPPLPEQRSILIEHNLSLWLGNTGAPDRKNGQGLIAVGNEWGRLQFTGIGRAS